MPSYALARAMSPSFRTGIWHVDERVTASNTKPQMTAAEHYRISVEQADGLFDLERNVNTGDAGDIFVPGTSFSPFTTPDSDWWDGSDSGLSLDHIQFLPNDQIQFEEGKKRDAQTISE